MQDSIKIISTPTPCNDCNSAWVEQRVIHHAGRDIYVYKVVCHCANKHGPFWSRKAQKAVDEWNAYVRSQEADFKRFFGM